MREGEAIKKGLLLKNSKLKESNIELERSLKDPPISMYLAEAHNSIPPEKLFERKFSPERSSSPMDFVRHMKPELKSSIVYKPLKKVF